MIMKKSGQDIFPLIEKYLLQIEELEMENPDKRITINETYEMMINSFEENIQSDLDSRISIANEKMNAELHFVRDLLVNLQRESERINYDQSSQQISIMVLLDQIAKLRFVIDICAGHILREIKIQQQTGILNLLLLILYNC